MSNKDRQTRQPSRTTDRPRIVEQKNYTPKPGNVGGNYRPTTNETPAPKPPKK